MARARWLTSTTTSPSLAQTRQADTARLARLLLAQMLVAGDRLHPLQLARVHGELKRRLLGCRAVPAGDVRLRVHPVGRQRWFGSSSTIRT